MPYYVYVVELDDAAGPRVRPDKPVVYVGQSFHAPEVRFQQHLDGVRASKWVRNFGVRLRPRLAAAYNPLATQEEALEAERRLAERLRKRGFTVRGGH